jgi:diadenosine tetraphosphate (Ap4A) HIT family hydrolase
MRLENFYDFPVEQHIGQTEHFFLMYDGYPVSPGHILIISKELRTDYFKLSADERADLDNAILLAKRFIDDIRTPDGYNIGMNCGVAAGQTVFHFHCHVIPRYAGDMDDPSGGVRHCVEGKGYYQVPGD